MFGFKANLNSGYLDCSDGDWIALMGKSPAYFQRRRGCMIREQCLGCHIQHRYRQLIDASVVIVLSMHRVCRKP